MSLILIFLPYFILVYQKISIPIRLLFISLFEIFSLVMFITVTTLFKLDTLSKEIFFYALAVPMSIFINVFIILAIWIVRKIRFNKN